MQSVPPAITPLPVVTSQNIVPLMMVVGGVLCFMTLAGVTAYSIKKTGDAEALSGMAKVGNAFRWLPNALG